MPIKLRFALLLGLLLGVFLQAGTIVRRHAAGVTYLWIPRADGTVVLDVAAKSVAAGAPASLEGLLRRLPPARPDRELRGEFVAPSQSGRGTRVRRVFPPLLL